MVCRMADRAYPGSDVSRIRFKCLGTECNRCCDGGETGSFVVLTRKDVGRLGTDISRVTMRKVNGQWAMTIPPGELCVFWEEGVGCSIWERRPTVCFTYPAWKHLLESKEAIEKEKERCPGLGQGPRLVLHKLRARMRRAGRL